MPYRIIDYQKDSLIHVYNRGNAGALLFRSESDYQWFSKKLYQPDLTNRCLIPTYCLMPTHFHFLIKLKTDSDLSQIMQSLELAYAKYFNRKY